MERIQLSIDHFEKMLITVDSNLKIAKFELNLKKEERLNRARLEFDLRKQKYDLLQDDEDRNSRISKAEKDFLEKVEEIEEDYEYKFSLKENSAKCSKHYYEGQLALQKQNYVNQLKRQRQRLGIDD